MQINSMHSSEKLNVRSYFQHSCLQQKHSSVSSDIPRRNQKYKVFAFFKNRLRRCEKYSHLTLWWEVFENDEVAKKVKERAERKKGDSCILYLEAVPRAVIQAWNMPAKKEKGFFLVTRK